MTTTATLEVQLCEALVRQAFQLLDVHGVERDAGWVRRAVRAALCDGYIDAGSFESFVCDRLAVAGHGVRR